MIQKVAEAVMDVVAMAVTECGRPPSGDDENLDALMAVGILGRQDRDGLVERNGLPASSTSTTAWPQASRSRRPEG